MSKSIPAAALAAAERFVVPLIEGARDFEGPDSTPDVVGLGLSIADWKVPEDGWSPDFTVEHFSEVFPRRKPRPLTADRCASVILEGFDDEILCVDMYNADEIGLLLDLGPCCGPTNWERILDFVEAWEKHAPDEVFEPGHEGWSGSEWSIPSEAA